MGVGPSCSEDGEWTLNHLLKWQAQEGRASATLREIVCNYETQILLPASTRKTATKEYCIRKIGKTQRFENSSGILQSDFTVCTISSPFFQVSFQTSANMRGR